MRKGRLAWFGVLALACGGGHDGRLLAVDPDPATVLVGETLPMTAQPAAELDGTLEWEVQEMYGGGLLQSQGLHTTYVPPEAAGTYHIALRLTGRDGRVHKEMIEVRVLASAGLEPAAPRLQPGFSLLFRARMKGLGRDAVTWAVTEPDGGEIGADGRYTAPRRPGVYHVTATSTLDPAVVATATVTVAEN